MEEELAEKLKDEEIPLTSAEKVRESEGAHQRTTGGIESNFQQLKFVDYESMSKTPLVASKKKLDVVGTKDNIRSNSRSSEAFKEQLAKTKSKIQGGETRDPAEVFSDC